MAVWADSETVCCLADDERYLGHTIKAENGWLAFDATHLSQNRTSFRCLGCYATNSMAKFMVEQVFSKDRPMVATLQ